MVLVFPALSIEVFSQTDQVSGADGNAYVTGITSGRAKSLIGGALGLVSVVIGWKLKPRKRSWYVTGFVLGAAALILSIIHLVNLTGGFGTGGGKAGAIVGAVLGIVGCALSVRAFQTQKS
ncbi:hypothetical protein DQQ10_05635 [Pseudochryseolinea flava]|uniref:Uncharacterized protein n=2 Tax=Pseudochryseolinea flava TaxID=2059302 RepID=A0A364Y4W4_9BACT|nr:hypothetical protein DQQ10_05635 [Pseudochryseolinea flava]